MPEPISILLSDKATPTPKLHQPDKFEQEFGIIGSNYNSAQGLRRLKDNSLLEKPAAYDSANRWAVRILAFVESQGWATTSQIVKGAAIKKCVGIAEISSLYAIGKLHREPMGRGTYYYLPGTPMPVKLIKREKSL